MKKTFRDLGIREDILEAIEKKGYEHPSPIQEQVIPLLLTGTKDIIGQAQTGTGKTASFGIPLLQNIAPSKKIKGIILCPTRELAIQVSDEIYSFSPKKHLSTTLLYGGNPIRDEIRALKSNPDIVIGTPGRIIDHLQKGRLDMSSLEYFVLDEADEMLNIGFREEIEEIMSKTPKEKKVLLFSATMPKEIMSIAKNYMGEYDIVSVKSQNLTNASITQKYYEVGRHHKFDALTRIIETQEEFYSIIFCKTKLDVDDLAAKLMSKGYPAEGIHGDVEQRMREKILSRFKAKKVKILVATDVAARGIDVNDITHVINYALPDNPETYTHRIGRTGRAGKEGTAITFVTPAERRKIFYFENVIKAKIKKETLPNVAQVVEMKKVHLLESIKELIDSGEAKASMEIAKELLQIEDDAELIIAGLVQKFCKNDFNPDSYTEITQNSKVIRTGSSSNNGEKRLFVAKGRNHGMDNPGKILNFLGTETGIDMKNAGKIEILRDFSYINLPEYEAEVVLQVFKEKDKRKPVVVQAKAKTGGNRSRGRSNGFRKRSR